jgi:uncharacterized protein (TIGR02145 family)
MKTIFLTTAILLTGLFSMAQFRCGQMLDDPRDGQSYPTIWRQGQCWMATNLNFGNMITTGVVNINQTDNSIPEKFCYENNPEHCQTFGAMYQWDELMQYQRGLKIRGLCPEGWHIPSNEDFEVLAQTFSPESIGIDLQAGGNSGFDLPASGYCFFSGNGWNYNGKDSFGALRTSDESQANPSESLVRYYYPSDPGFYLAQHFKKENGYPARCIYSGQAIQAVNNLSFGEALPFSFYPNPAREELYVDVAENQNQAQITLRIVDGSGRILLNTSLKPGKNSISLSGLARGFAIVQILTESVITQVHHLHIL